MRHQHESTDAKQSFQQGVPKQELGNEAVACVNPWAPYRPSPEQPWNIRRVVHLHRRAGFGAAWAEIQRDLADGVEASVSRVLGTGEGGRVEDVEGGRVEGGRVKNPSSEPSHPPTHQPSTASPSFDHLAAVIGSAAVDSGSAERLKAWWLYRCLFSPRSLEERLTLMWHNHFATSNLKVNDLRAMQQQNKVFREFGRGKFGELLARVVHDPAVLAFLDAPSNRREQPNENFSRELLELFTLGVGNYSEDDVKQSARALTGWTVRQGNFRELPAAHDDGEKTILGKTGPWSGDDLVQMLVEHPATAKRLAWRLCELLLGEEVLKQVTLPEKPPLGQGGERQVRDRSPFPPGGGRVGDGGDKLPGTSPITPAPDPSPVEGEGRADNKAKGGRDSSSALDALAEGLRQHDLDIAWGLETILRSELFFSDANIGTRVCDPVSFAVAPLVALECRRDPPSTVVLAEWVSRMGMDLFHPPNVGGWPGGRTWLSTRTVIARTNYIIALAEGALTSPPRPPDLAGLVARHASGADAAGSAKFLSQLLFGEFDEETLARVETTQLEKQPPLAATLVSLLTGPRGHVH